MRASRGLAASLPLRANVVFRNPKSSESSRNWRRIWGGRLLLRTTRAVALTEAGAEFLARVDPILAALDDAEHSVREGGALRGLLGVSMPTSFGIPDAIPCLAAFAARHPNLHLQLLLEDRRQDLVRDAVDVAVRFGRLVESTATMKLIATIPRVAVASPDYLVRHGVPATPNDLVQHRIVGGSAAAVPTAWTFGRDGKELKMQLEENEGAIAAAVAGFGITSTSGWACRRELEDGSLVRCFRIGKWSAFQFMPIFRWVERPARQRVRPWTISLLILSNGQIGIDRGRSRIPTFLDLFGEYEGQFRSNRCVLLTHACDT
jgi:DNA-binding transcriptional LysR family regulator